MIEKLLEENIKLLDNATSILQISYNECMQIAMKKEYDYDDMTKFEALTSRFARVSDMIVQKTLRLINEYDLETDGTVRDIINRAEKKKIIDNADILIDIRNIRNEIAHEYCAANITDIFTEVLNYCPYIFELVENIKKYLKQKI